MARKGSPNLYEILKSSKTIGPKEPLTSEAIKVAPEPEPPKTPASKLEAPPEPKPEMPRSPIAEVEPLPVPPAPVKPMTRPAPETRIVPRVVMRPAEPTVPQPTQDDSPGERTITITYNTAGFLILVLFGLLFVGYSFGVRSGRAQAAVPAEETQPTEIVHENEDPNDETGVPTEPTPAPKPVWAIHLMRWKAETEQDRMSSQNLAQIHIDNL